MKAVLKKVSPPPETSFTVRKDVGENMRNSWHYHPELELLYIKKSAGTWLIGDYIGPFHSGDVVLIGANLPHSFRHEDTFIRTQKGQSGEAIVALFKQDIPDSTLAALPEMRKLTHLLSLSRQGIKLEGNTARKVAVMMEDLPELSPGNRLLTLLQILYLIAESGDYTLLSTQYFNYTPSHNDNHRLKTVIAYTHKHFRGKLSLEEAAEQIHMTVTSFCRYFKMETGKTYVRFLTELRIGYACQLLMDTDKNITEICYECGYNTLSHFINMFKLITGKRPVEYKKHFK
ncbi:AraC family transcriptional regulator [Chitinophaga arvensicola]|uniref:AraC-type DNA-binding protein n=1 Tax=Chitinophaga arvensicola TaxID=29529 RepID=A0A1I0RGL6_9BACT|nr:AraC family transcriptional regulator [Chitinophaga arvensicola]SEW39930.1 AraC-type DNA-binding protein [Chitinophaga arvensicola]